MFSFETVLLKGGQFSICHFDFGLEVSPVMGYRVGQVHAFQKLVLVLLVLLLLLVTALVGVVVVTGTRIIIMREVERETR